MLIAIGQVTKNRKGVQAGSSTRRIALADSTKVALANAIVQTGSIRNHSFMIDPITVATSNCGTTTKTLNSSL